MARSAPLTGGHLSMFTGACEHSRLCSQDLLPSQAQAIHRLRGQICPPACARPAAPCHPLSHRPCRVPLWRRAAPEVLLGRGATPASDIYSFGVILWELCSGGRLGGRLSGLLCAGLCWNCLPLCLVPLDLTLLAPPWELVRAYGAEGGAIGPPGAVGGAPWGALGLPAPHWSS